MDPLPQDNKINGNYEFVAYAISFYDSRGESFPLSLQIL